jgi:hypothetical protein
MMQGGAGGGGGAAPATAESVLANLGCRLKQQW